MNTLKREYMTVEELYTIPAGNIFIFDVECYRNFFLVAFKCLSNGKYFALERSADFNFNELQLKFILWRFLIVGFNSNSYDIPMLELASKGLSCSELKDASDYIIKSGINYGNKKVTPYDIEKKYKIKIGDYNTIDLFNVCPVNGGVSANPASLKLYAGRLHAPKMQDLPYPPDLELSQFEAEEIRKYCCNDLDNTEILFKELSSEIKLRVEMSQEYKVDLRSKSDAQIAESVIGSELEKVLGCYPKRPIVKEGEVLKYNKPDFIEFKTKELNNILDIIVNSEFYLDGLGSPIMPTEIEKLKVSMGSSIYKLGMGGLHSTEKSICHFATDDIMIADNDVESFYPKIILNQGLFPPHLGKAFLNVYKHIVEKRVDAKGKAKALKSINKIEADSFKTIADTLKIVINGSFGKLGNKYSILYAPQLMLQVTITGQLVLLMLIEMLELAGIEVISANTDGVVSKYHKSRHDEVRSIISMWEQKTNFKTEETKYKAVFSRDVNSYIAIKEKGDESKFLDDRLGCKTKGVFSERGSALNSILSKNPENLVCIDAVLQFLTNSVPLEKTIKECKDIRRFVSVKNVKGGGVKDGIYLGKVVRWYYAKNEKGFIAYKTNGNKVGKTDGAKPLMNLPEHFPNDIDYDKYIKEALEMLYDCGYYKKAGTQSLW